jgi:RNA polymerase sigma-70 factor (ECF subfamily)
MDRYVDGDPSAFAGLHRRLDPRLRSFLLKLLRDPAVCDELVQLTFLKAHLARHRFMLQGGDPDGAVQHWYFAIARNVAMDHLRERYRLLRRAAPAGNGTDPVDALLDDTPGAEALGLETEREQEIVAQVRAAVDQLPPSQREVVELHKLRGMTMAEIAHRLQVGEGAVRVRAHRAYKSLARLLTPKGLHCLPVLLMFIP